MKSGRDYEIDVDMIPPDEPVFLIRGQDICAPATLMEYARLAKSVGASEDLVDSVLKHAAEMLRFQSEVTRKVPDL